MLLRELLLLDVHYRQKAGESPRAEDYQAYLGASDADWLAEVLAGLSPRPPIPAPPTGATWDFAAPSNDSPAALFHPRPFGNYVLLGEIGRGGMGVVYRASQVGLNRTVALKMILAGEHAGAEDLTRFKGEAQAVARLAHPHIVTVHEVGEHGGLPYFALEFCPGGSLEKKLAGTPLPPREAAVLVEKLARGMHAAHKVKVIHRDLKPANVLFLADGTPKITDFGLARKLDEESKTQTGAIMGTPSYMAPEQAGGKKDIGPPADVYALGAILYQCLTGRPPFKAATSFDTILQVVGDEPAPPRQLNAKVAGGPGDDLPEMLAEGAGQALRQRSGARGRSGTFPGVQADPARPVGRMEQTGKWVRRNPAVAALTTAVALVLLMGVAMSSYFAFAAHGEAVAARKAEEEAKAKTKAAEYQALRANTARHAIQMDGALRAWRERDIARAEEILADVEPAFQQTWETRHLRSICRRTALPLLGHIGSVTSVAISSDGTRIVSGSSSRFDAQRKPLFGEVRVWDAATGQEMLSLKGHAAGVSSVAISRDGTRIVSGSFDKTVKVWDAATGQEMLTLKGHTAGVSSVAISRDGTRIVSGSFDKTVKVWDAATGQEMLTLKGHTAGVYSVAISRDGTRIVSGSGDLFNQAKPEVKVWDAATGQEMLSLKGHTRSVGSVAYSRDGTRIISGSWDKTVKVWDAATGQEMLSLKGHTDRAHSVAISRDGTRIVSGSEDKTVKVWDAATGQEMLSLKGHAAGVSSVAISRDGTRIVSGSSDNTVKVWDAPAAKP